MAFSFKMPQLPACCRPGYIGMTPSGGQRGSARAVGGKELWTRGRLRNVPSLFAEKRISATPQRGKVKLRPIFGRDCRAANAGRSPWRAGRIRVSAAGMQFGFGCKTFHGTLSEGAGGIVVRGYVRETDFFHGCLRSAFVSITNLRKTFDACKFFFMFFAWLFTAFHGGGFLRLAVCPPDGLFSAGVYVFRTCVYGSRKTRVYIFRFNRQMCLLISGKDIRPYSSYK